MGWKTVIVDCASFDAAIQAFCKRNGVSVKKVADTHGFTNKFIINGRNTFQKKHPECKKDYIEISETGYQSICTAFLLTPERYIITNIDEIATEEHPAESKPVDKTAIAYIRMVNERLLDIEKIQEEQTQLLKRLLEVWEKT